MRPALARTYEYAHAQKCVILIAFPQQLWLGERASALLTHCMYITCLVSLHFSITHGMYYLVSKFNIRCGVNVLVSRVLVSTME